MSNVAIEAQKRTELGTGASRRLRKTNLVPAVIYGGTGEPVSAQVKNNELKKLIENQAVFSQVLTISVDGTEQKAIIKDLQRHPVTSEALHIDFLRVDESIPVKISVPLVFENEASCYGVKVELGRIAKQASQIAIIALPKDIPASIVIDLKDIKARESVRPENIQLPEGVSFASSKSMQTPLVICRPPRGGMKAAS